MTAVIEPELHVDETANPALYSLRTHTFGLSDEQIFVNLRSINKDYYGSKVNLTGCATWFAGEVFCSYIMNNPELFQGNKSILELGSGAGLTGILLQKVRELPSAPPLGMYKVVLTDGEQEVVDLLKSNCSANGLADSAVDTQLLLWGAEQEAAKALLQANPLGFDVIIGCDLFYNRQQSDKVELAFASVSLLLSHGNPNAVFYLAFTRRDLDINVVLEIAGKKCFAYRVIDECTHDIFGTETDGLTDFWRDCVYEFKRATEPASDSATE